MISVETAPTSNALVVQGLGVNEFAIFITKQGNRYAISNAGINHPITYKEVDGGWERWESMYTFCLWNAELQGIDDITSRIIK